MFCLIGVHSYIPYKFDWNKDHNPINYDYDKKKAWTGEFHIKELICQRCGKVKQIPNPK